MPYFRKKPVTIEARRLDSPNAEDIGTADRAGALVFHVFEIPPAPVSSEEAGR